MHLFLSNSYPSKQDKQWVTFFGLHVPVQPIHFIHLLLLKAYPLSHYLHVPSLKDYQVMHPNEQVSTQSPSCSVYPLTQLVQLDGDSFEQVKHLLSHLTQVLAEDRLYESIQVVH